MDLPKKYQGRQVIHNQVFERCAMDLVPYRDIILDPGCSDFGILPPRPFKPAITVALDRARNVWVKSNLEEYKA